MFGETTGVVCGQGDRHPRVPDVDVGVVESLLRQHPDSLEVSPVHQQRSADRVAGPENLLRDLGADQRVAGLVAVSVVPPVELFTLPMPIAAATGQGRLVRNDSLVRMADDLAPGDGGERGYDSLLWGSCAVCNIAKVADGEGFLPSAGIAGVDGGGRTGG